MAKPRSYRHVRILSLDGGGLYGLTGAILLRKLAERHPRFLRMRTEGVYHMFAGCSSGAINALLLAKHECPRDALLGGELERFWQDPRVFAPGLPLLGPSGVTGLFSADQFIAVLREYFQDLRLGDLPWKVLISTFNWTGSVSQERMATPDPGASPDHGFASPFLADGQWQWRTRAGQRQRHWRPKFFDNLTPDDEDNSALAVHVAYAAAAPPGFRALLNGLGDGASFNSNPSVPALARVVNSFRAGAEADEVALYPVESWRDVRAYVVGEAHEHYYSRIGTILRRTAMLSVGSGQVLPHYGFEDFNFGFMTFMMTPTNPWKRALAPPTMYSLDPAAEESDYIVKQLLTRERALRLNPPINEVPTILAALMARSTWHRQRLIQAIYAATESEEATRAIDNTAAFLANDYARR